MSVYINCILFICMYSFLNAHLYFPPVPKHQNGLNVQTLTLNLLIPLVDVLCKTLTPFDSMALSFNYLMKLGLTMILYTLELKMAFKNM